MMKNEIEPPWVAFPGYPPGDGFWRQSGENWLRYIWEPYWNALSPERKKEYLEKWMVPKEWHDFYFDQSFNQWLHSVDEQHVYNKT